MIRSSSSRFESWYQQASNDETLMSSGVHFRHNKRHQPLKMRCSTSIALIVTLSICLLSCQHKPSKPDPALANIELLRGDILLCSGRQLGEVNFSLSCKAAVRENFDLAMSLLHSFEYDEAEKAFVKVIDADPECAMAYWGVAMSIYHALWAPPSTADMKKGVEILEIAKSIPKSPREQAYIDAISMYYQDWQNVDSKSRALRMTNKMEEIYLTYPEDTEAAILYALALNSTADPSDLNYTNQKKAGRILEELFVEQPTHPGIAHYIIHNYDNPRLAERALSTARAYAQIAPSSSHAQHMPSHIFTRLGLWDESISSNINSTASARCYADEVGFDANWDEELHGMDYLVYAYLQMGNNSAAISQYDYLTTMKAFYPENFKVAYALAAIPVRIALENKDWTSAARLKTSHVNFPWKEFPWQRSIVHFARSLGLSHLNNLAEAEREIDTLVMMRELILNENNLYQGTQVMIQIKAARAWLNHAKGNEAIATELMTEAAIMEDNTSKHPVTPCEVLPARELLGDLLLAQGKSHQALEAYKEDLSQHPRRFNGIYGAATAAKLAGELDECRVYFEQLIEQVGSENSERPEVKEAYAYLGYI